MVTFKLTQDQAKSWFPETYHSFITELRSSKSLSKDTLEENMNWFLNWGFFVKKSNTEEEKYHQQENYKRKMELVYEDRVKLEMPRIRCSLNFKAGYYHKMDRVLERIVPEFVESMAKEVIKYMIVQERNFVGNIEVMESIKEFYDNLIENSGMEDSSLDMDSILDKISEKGMESLSPRELQYLKNMSDGK